ncbi:winged helix-turn-helix domain-containing protein [Streptomyces sp. NBC_01775]|uniref:winged helix-turn-helix domain-containing protein n=1 Tax=Streptomyces sp. NBC_01775 TaxID=2975939 RepID=UPI002DD8AD55|nr:winged helix-turn-helix domain-containing protein [Streptomyces sp. NBC_01775]WSB74700.1 winged helix-turn-helix domain-containing protein [Streptomyces sp. NBC_01775]
MGDDLGGRVDPAAPVYVYIQVADDIEARINTGTLRPGARLPGERDLAEQYGVAYGSARRAIEELRDRGLAITLPGKGTFIQTRTGSADSGDA